MLRLTDAGCELRCNRDLWIGCECKPFPLLVHEGLACLQDDFEACITHLRFPLAHRQAIRTTNLLEQLFGEERRRTEVIPHAFGERAMLKLMYAASDPSGRTLARLAHERIRAPTADRHS